MRKKQQYIVSAERLAYLLELPSDAEIVHVEHDHVLDRIVIIAQSRFFDLLQDETEPPAVRL